jgi:hypothetical protein
MPAAPKKGKPRLKSLAWSCDRFAYTKRQCQYIYELLDLNKNDVVKVFGCIWCDRKFTDEQRRVAPMLLGLVERISVLKTGYICGRNPERVWEFIHSGGKSGQIVYSSVLCPPHP